MNVGVDYIEFAMFLCIQSKVINTIERIVKSALLRYTHAYIGEYCNVN